MEKPYNEIHFCIDMIQDVHKTANPLFISLKLQEVFGETVSISAIKDYLNHTEDFEQESYTIKMKDIFSYEQISFVS